MGEREWMHEESSSSRAGNGAERMARRFATTDWLSGPKFVQLVVALVVLGAIALFAAARWG